MSAEKKKKHSKLLVTFSIVGIIIVAISAFVVISLNENIMIRILGLRWKSQMMPIILLWLWRN